MRIVHTAFSETLANLSSIIPYANSTDSRCQSLLQAALVLFSHARERTCHILKYFWNHAHASYMSTS